VNEQEALPKDFEKKAKQRFSEIVKPEVAFEQFLEFEKQEFQRQRQLEKNPQLKYLPGLPGMTPCGNGDFEIDIATSSQWKGAYGTNPASGVPNFPSFTTGIVGGAINLGTSHQTWVGTGTDSSVGISLTAPGSSQHAVRIGNAFSGGGCELLSKTFTVTAAQRVIKFWYAVILENPGPPISAIHLPAEQPFFWVRVTDSAGNIVPGAVNLGNGSDKAVADANNPFFQTHAPLPQHDAKIVYKDWSCAQIDLSSQVGKTVTVEFVTADCTQYGHFGYAYIDNFCGTCAGSPEGNITFDAAGSSNCGPGRLCFNYELPKSPTGATGSITITLHIYQSGVLLTQMFSPTLTSGANYCFAITPMSIAGIDPALGGFDFVAKGDFAIGTATLAPMTVGAAPDGRVFGKNNDYQIQCKFFSYAVKFICGIQSDCACDCAPVRPGNYATEINIYNHTDKQATIRKHVVPVVLAGAPAGREPRVVPRRAEDRIVLPPHSATMDDCCRIAELLLGAPPQGSTPLTVGFLEIVSPIELSITAVYTASGPDGKTVSIDVEQIVPKVVLV
jgi:hypothetical protein